ncbi:MAG: hypothetical protein RLY78_3523 [Pseudomonadota bacterium]
MATTLLALLDDIASVLDDVASMTQVAARKTAGVLGDDLALNAQQVSGVRAERELPVVWAVARGSLVNKAILIPLALLISQLAPWAVQPLLMLGGAYLCFEGAEKLAHRLLQRWHDPQGAHRAHGTPAPGATEAMVPATIAQIEREKVRGAVRTDFVLSAEIIVITLGTVSALPLGQQLAVLAGVGALMTVGVYGLVAGIVKLDDLGAWLLGRPGASAAGRGLGRALLQAAPRLMRLLAVAGTVAMFLVGGSIVLHGLVPLHHALQPWLEAAGAPPAWLRQALADLGTGLVTGLLVLAVVEGVAALRARGAARS